MAGAKSFEQLLNLNVVMKLVVIKVCQFKSELIDIISVILHVAI